LRSYQLGGGYTPGALYVLLAAAGLAGSGLLLLRRRLQADARQIALACVLFTLSGVFVLLVSDLFEFSWRYQLPALVTLVPGGALGLAAAIRHIQGRHHVQAGS
jgi:drug/metabolite transporter (DMT)-like permease